MAVLQWGRVVADTEWAPGRRPSPRAAPALQWGRVVADTECRDVEQMLSWASETGNDLLQWGRVVADTEWFVRAWDNRTLDTLQWGRVVADTE